jgi:two-component system cell cycle response regulator
MTSLSVLLVSDDKTVTDLARDALEPWGDALTVEPSPTQAIEGSVDADAVLVDLGLENGAGLAVAHFLAARDASVPVIALSAGTDSETDTVAQALGVRTVLARPLTGDALLVALSHVREGRASLDPSSPYNKLTSLPPPSKIPRIDGATMESVLEATDLPSLAEAIAQGAFVLTGRGARVRLENARFETLEAAAGAPIEDTYDEVPIGSRDETLETLYARPDPLQRGTIEQLARSAGAIGVLLRAQESAARAGIKDPETSAYTFAYFVDAAGREVERAQRHSRRFGLLTFQLDDWNNLRESRGELIVREARRELVDTILDTAADIDLLALVEEDELYLLSPESGRLKTLALRRRIAEKHRRRAELARLEGRVWFSVAIGAATFPRDGRDLATLTRAASTRGRRAEEHDANWKESSSSLDAALGALLRLRPGAADWALRQGAMSADVIQSMGFSVSREAVRSAGPNDGVAYVLGERGHPLVIGAYEAMKRAPAASLPCYWLRPNVEENNEPSAPGTRLSPVEVEVEASRVGPFALLAVLTEAWAYACVASTQGAYKRVMHTSDLELVESLVAEVQRTFHLQREGE